MSIANAPEKEQKIKSDADWLIGFADHDGKGRAALALMLQAILAGNEDCKADYWSWKVANFMERHTDTIEVDMDSDVSFERGDEGEIYASGGELPVGCTLVNREHLQNIYNDVLTTLGGGFEYVDAYLEESPEGYWRPLPWVCKKCGRNFKKKLDNSTEIRDLLADFSKGKYWRCRSCKTLNYFRINPDGSMDFLIST